MNNGFILVLMVFLHIVDDYYLQGILSQMKQRSWWAKNAPDKLYGHDWIVAMVMHAFSWAFMIMLPWAIQCRFQPDFTYFVLLGINVVAHFVVDDMKANQKMINLVTDQAFHFLQIFTTWAAMMEVLA